jgi:hypothetical protein
MMKRPPSFRALAAFYFMWIISIALALASTKFVSPDHSFELSVLPGYIVHIGKDKPSDSYIPVCHPDSVVCITFPEERFKGTNFGAASVEVAILPDKTSQACLNPGKNASSVELINGTRFVHTLDGGAAMSHFIEIDRYLGFSKGKCFELSAQITSTYFGAFDPGTIKEFTKQDEKRVNAQLTRIVDSFRALP